MYFMDIIDWWLGLPRWLRFGVAFAFLACGLLLLLVSTRAWAVPLALGIAFLIFSFPTNNEKKGYHDL